jgi:hypothetical protein
MAGTTTLAPPGRHHKRTVSDQQKRRELALQRQKQSRRDLQHHARQLALSAPNVEAVDAYGEQPEEFVENQVRTRNTSCGHMFRSVSSSECRVVVCVFRFHCFLRVCDFYFEACDREIAVIFPGVSLSLR